MNGEHVSMAINRAAGSHAAPVQRQSAVDVGTYMIREGEVAGACNVL